MEPAVHSPLEEFVRDYVEVTGGVWDEVEPQVYDVLLPSAEGDRDVVRIAFDPEAVPEHPGAQLASFGTPLIDRLLSDAVERGRFARLYLIGLNLNPHDLAGRVRRALTLPPGAAVRIERVRALHFSQAVFWFQATFVSDQKEQEIVPVVLDLHYGRQVRHLEELLEPARLSETPSLPLPDAQRLSLAAAYPIARERVVRTLAALANTRGREQSEHVEKQILRMTRYYADLREELEEQVKRATTRGEDLSKFAGRREALEREEKVRVAELRQKSTLRVTVRLLLLLLVQEPKLLVRGAVVAEGKSLGALELVWDPLVEAVEALPCPECGRPTFGLELTRAGKLVCPACAAVVPPKGKTPHR
ncbi:MAG TPA: TFIIB-type zinc ribbon-containing protein [Gemmataceae bacterium]|nr:TFIIB-type zinc ribbon-containing protein [Gemmataceae bacterium]